MSATVCDMKITTRILAVTTLGIALSGFGAAVTAPSALASSHGTSSLSGDSTAYFNDKDDTILVCDRAQFHPSTAVAYLEIEKKDGSGYYTLQGAWASGGCARHWRNVKMEAQPYRIKVCDVLQYNVQVNCRTSVRFCGS